MAARVGNNSANTNHRLWANTLRRIVTQTPERLRKVAEVVVSCAEKGEPWAVTELANRLDGKPMQQVTMEASFTGKLAEELTNEQLAIIAAGGTLANGDESSMETLQ
jgi:hypothetical protein